jgi:hypothetical protein
MMINTPSTTKQGFNLVPFHSLDREKPQTFHTFVETQIIFGSTNFQSTNLPIYQIYQKKFRQYRTCETTLRL